MQNCLHSQTTFFDSPFWLPAALNDYATFEHYSTMWYFFSCHFFILLSYVPIQPKLFWLHEMFMYSSEIKKKKKKEVRFCEINHFLPGTCGCEDGSCLLTTWESEKCLRTVIRQWDSGRRGQSIWGQVHREDPSQQIIPKCISRMNFLFLPSFVINYFSFSMEKKSEKFILCLSIFYLIT